MWVQPAASGLGIWNDSAHLGPFRRAKNELSWYFEVALLSFMGGFLEVTGCAAKLVDKEQSRDVD